jgi:hypothetical protein
MASAAGPAGARPPTTAFELSKCALAGEGEPRARRAAPAGRQSLTQRHDSPGHSQQSPPRAAAPAYAHPSPAPTPRRRRRRRRPSVGRRLQNEIRARDRQLDAATKDMTALKTQIAAKER